MMFDLKLEQINVNISGIVHFKHDKLKRSLLDIGFDLQDEDIEELTISISVSVIAKY